MHFFILDGVRGLSWALIRGGYAEFPVDRAYEVLSALT